MCRCWGTERTVTKKRVAGYNVKQEVKSERILEDKWELSAQAKKMGGGMEQCNVFWYQKGLI